MRRSVTGMQAVLAVLALLVAVPLSAAAQISSDPSQAQSISSPAAQSPWELFTSSGTLYTMDMIDANDGWTGGVGGKLYHYTGTEWAPYLTDFDPPIRGLGMVDSNSGWGVTFKGQMIRYSGGVWSMYGTVAGAPLNDVIMSAENNGWAVGGIDPTSQQSTILRYNGWSWDPVTSNRTYWLQAIDMVAANDVWVVGAGGTILRWNGSTWFGPTLGPQYTFYDVDMVSSDDVWIVGAGGTIMHFDGTDILPVASPTSRDLTAVSMASANDGWAVGNLGTILHWDGQTWEIVPSPTTMALNDVEMVSSTEGWIVGSGVILRYLGTSDLSASAKSVTPDRADFGDTLTYSINVRNTGTAVAPAVTVTDTLPVDLALLPATVVVPGAASIVGYDPLVVALGDVPAGADLSITFQATIDPAGSGCAILPNQALIGSQGAQIVRQAGVIVGTCPHVFVPLTLR